MYPFLLSAHSYIRWIFILAAAGTVILSLVSYLRKAPLSSLGARLRTVTVATIHTQLLIGILFFFTSPVVQNFWSGVPQTMKTRGLRYFGMEHPLMMIIATVLLTIGSVRAKKATDQTATARITFWWFAIGTLIVLATIPWPFSGDIARPLFR